MKSYVNQLLLFMCLFITLVGCQRAEQSPPLSPATTPSSTAATSDVKSNVSPVSETNAAAAAPADVWPVFRGSQMGSGVSHGEFSDQAELLWKYSVASGSFEGTPAIQQGIVYLGDMDGTVDALKLDNGEEVWKKKFGTSGFSAAAAVDDTTLYLGNQDGDVWALDIANGSERWKFHTAGQFYGELFWCACPLQLAGWLAPLSRQKNRRHHLEISNRRPAPCCADDCRRKVFLVGCDAHLSIIDVATGEKTGSVPINSPAGATAAAYDEQLFFGTSSGEFFAIDVEKQEVLWTWQDKARQMPISASAAVTGDLVYLAGEDKTLLRIQSHDGRTTLETTVPRKARKLAAGRRQARDSSEQRRKNHGVQS